jgi:hypothetical protein
VSWAIKETGNITLKKINSKPIIETFQYLKEIYSFSEKDHSDHDSKEYPVDLSPNIRHTHGMSDEGDFSRITEPLKICEIFTPIYFRCGVNLFGIISAS